MKQRPSRFFFTDRTYDPRTGEIRLGYRLDDLVLSEKLTLPFAFPETHVAPEALAQALNALHWIAGISYWKAFCPDQWVFEDHAPDVQQARWLETIYREGLAEFAWRNQLNLQHKVRCPASDRPIPDRVAPTAGLGERVLLPLGGGKDSLVAWSRLHAQLGNESLITVQVGNAPLIQLLGHAMVQAGQVSAHWAVERMIDPKLLEINQQGAFNGHVPITAINHAVLTVLALLANAHWVVFANERSADEPTLVDVNGEAVNHQYSKSYAFETLFAQWLSQYVACDLKVFSILRQDRELAIAKEFATLDAFHQQFSSCNRHFHLDPKRRARIQWCGDCPKCHFVYLSLALWLSPDELVSIFGADLLDQATTLDGFRQLLALDGSKPFECVGEAAEARAAILALATDSRWSAHRVVKALAQDLEGFEVPALHTLLRPSGPHHIPKSLR